ncbi:hypothetical protein TCAL_04750 [Tigriopus californicus]|uniref:Nucleolar protein 6 n=1 Tax=Tigriopus californicus TaxID=6832 RepID=A0A553P2H4_TIGCA|nr:nucleolar protein 6-like [Tigriopus californicus]TRY71822.1 hypothetical protein TCAL_04750 [Tigriopus californicus]|eukprot:TCALIF_04750-PA protein Name:"Similar to nol6 Nucleolar protein 6 (Xenopus tropicalis)" AED:0.08 eAED:0.12 QI:0/-1/0/1/-1/1/1/0/641
MTLSTSAPNGSLAVSEVEKRTKVPGLSRFLAYDLTLNLTCAALKLKAAQKRWSDHWQPLLARGLSGVAAMSQPSWSQRPSGWCLTLGLRWISDRWPAHNVLIGPLAGPDSSSAQAFTQLWGPKMCQLRRFEDGAIRESVELYNPRGPMYFPVAIMEHLFQVHGPAQPVHIEVMRLDPDESLLPRSFQTHDEMKEVRQAMDSLSQMLIAQADPALPLRRARGQAACLHYGGDAASYRAPEKYNPNTMQAQSGRYELKLEAKMCPSECRAIPVILDITHRKNMRQELFEKLRLAYLLNVKKSLDARGSLTMVKDHNLYVKHEGYLFALDVEPPSFRSDADGGESLAVSSANSLLQLVGLRYSAWAGTCHLVKKWIASKMLESVLPAEMIEVMLADVFVNPLKNLSEPKSVETALLRFFDMLSFKDFHAEPIIFNDNDTIPASKINGLKKTMVTHRDTLPFFVIITPNEKSPSSLSAGVKPFIAKRLINLAKLTLAQLVVDSNLVLNEFKNTFKVDLSIYDVIIHLKPLQIPFIRNKVDVSATKDIDPKTFPVVDYNPVQCYLSDLRDSYGSVADFFYGQGTPAIGVKLTREALDQIPVKSRKQGGGKFILGGKRVHSIEAMIEDFEILGFGLVKSVETKLNSN